MCISIAFYCVINFVLWFYPLLVISNGNAKWSAGSAIGLTMFGVLVLSLTAGLSNISNSRILTLACYVALGVVSVWMSMTFASADGEVWKKWILSFTTFTSLLVLPILGTFRSLVKEKGTGWFGQRNQEDRVSSSKVGATPDHGGGSRYGMATRNEKGQIPITKQLGASTGRCRREGDRLKNLGEGRRILLLP